MHKFIVLALFAATLTAVAQSPTKATVYLYRLSGYEAGHVGADVFCDKTPILKLRNGRVVAIQLDPGTHVITSTFHGNGVILDAKAGDTYFVRVDLKLAGISGSVKFTATEMLPDQGKFETKQLKPVEQKDLKTDSAPVQSAAN